MASLEIQTIVLHSNSEEIAVSIGGKLGDTVSSIEGLRTPAEFAAISSPSGHTLTNTVPVKFLADEERLPADFVAALPEGPREFFATRANLR